MAIILKLRTKNEEETRQFAQQLARYCPPEIVIYLEGDLGAGKTTLARGFIQNFGFHKVKSPTYSLVESYKNDAVCIHHFDYYRLHNPEELDFIGVRDYQGIQLIEWAKLGGDNVAAADILIGLSGFDESRDLQITASTKIGTTLLDNF